MTTHPPRNSARLAMGYLEPQLSPFSCSSYWENAVASIGRVIGICPARDSSVSQACMCKLTLQVLECFRLYHGRRRDVRTSAQRGHRIQFPLHGRHPKHVSRATIRWRVTDFDRSVKLNMENANAPAKQNCTYIRSSATFRDNLRV